MKLSVAVDRLNKARMAHLRWVANAESLLAGLPLDKAQVPILPTDCVFGTWYHGEGWALRGLSAYAALNSPHEALHATYREIFVLLYGEDDRSSFAKLFGSKKDYKAGKVEEAKVFLPRLKIESKVLIRAIEILEHELTINSKGDEINAEVLNPNS